MMCNSVFFIRVGYDIAMKQAQKENERQAVVKMGMAMLIFGTIGICRRYIPFSSALLACVRGLAGAFFLLLIVCLRGVKAGEKTSFRTKLSFAFSGCLIGLNWMFLFEAYRYTSVGIATLCYYMQPVIVILLYPFLFHEHLTRSRLLCVLTAAAGMALITGVEPRGSLIGILYGLAAACLYAGVVICKNKRPYGPFSEPDIVPRLPECNEFKVSPKKKTHECQYPL